MKTSNKNVNKKKKQNNENERKKVLVLIFGIVAVLLAFIGATFAYFTAMINTVNGNESVVIKTVVVKELVYKQTDSILLDNVKPGTMDTGSFTVNNPNTNATATYSMEFVIDQNNFTNADGNSQLVFTLTGGSLTSPVVHDFTNSEINKPGNRIPLITNATIPSGATQTYQTKLEFVELDINQDTNQTKTFIGHIEGKGGDIIAENVD